MEPEYVDLSYEPRGDDVIMFAYVESSGDFRKACEQIAAESSVGTWTNLATMSDFAASISAKVFRIAKVTPDEGFIWIAYPKELFDENNLSQNFAILLGNLFELKHVKNMTILDIVFPKWFLKIHKGPKFGMKDIRKILGIEKRPFLATTMKPKLGLNTKKIVEIFYEAMRGGVDIVKDEEIVSNQSYCKFYERLDAVINAMEIAENETCEKKMYLVNVTDSYPRMIEKIDAVEESGNRAIMLNLLLLENDLRAVIDYAHSKGLVVFAHFTLQGAYSERVSPYVLHKLARILGFDIIHMRNPFGKLREGVFTSLYFHKALTSEMVPEALYLGILEQDMRELKPALPLLWGGTAPGQIEAMIKAYGFDIAIQSGGGIHGHPMGTYSGALAWRQAFDAVIDGIPVEEYARNARELAEAIRKWGVVKFGTLERARFIVEGIKDSLSRLVLEKGMEYIEFIDDLFLTLGKI